MPHDCILLITNVCSHCPALVANRHLIVHGYGDPQARVMIVGEAPGYLGADRTGVPFTGDRSGRRVQALLIRLGLSEESDPAVELPQLHGVFLTQVPMVLRWQPTGAGKVVAKDLLAKPATAPSAAAARAGASA